ncbi:MAG: AAA family ATPase [Clostridia bacterium]|nr:AAA family ATPase [Clostridia bacterium]
MSEYNVDAILKKASRINVDYFKEQQEDAINEIWKWWQSRDISFTLSGYAGTGKTFIMRHLVKYLITNGVCVTAPTHKALRVLENSSGKKGMTIQSLCGLRPDVDVEDYDIENPSFKVIGDQKMKEYKLIIVDECSMVNPGLFQLLIKTANQFKVKILFLGDELQIPYVVKSTKEKQADKNRISPAFTNTDKHFRLTQIVRQEKGNPLLELFGIIRSDLVNGTTNFYQYILENRGECNDRGEGFTIMNKVDFSNKVVEIFSSQEFSNDINYVRCIAYTNECVRYWNTFIRTNVLNNPTTMITKDDMFTAYRTVFDEFKSPIIVNSEDYIVENMRYYVADNKLACYCVTLRSAFDGKVTPMFKIVDFWDDDNMSIFARLINAIHYKALNGTERTRWFRYFRFKDVHLMMTDFRLSPDNKNRIVGKDIDYGYGLTAHKSQGSTFQNVCIDLDDIIYARTKYNTRVRREPREALRLLYVAMSRASKHAYLKL